MKTNTRGFTIIELMLAMMFLTAILLISSTAIVQAFGMYNKGLVIKQINQAGRTLTEDMTRAANNAAITDTTDSNTHVLCLGSTVYAWNTPEQIISDNTKKYDNGQVINFVKINDASACSSSIGVTIDENRATELLSSNIRVFSAKITKVAGDVVNIEFVFGTYDPSDSDSVINPKETSPGNGKWECDGTSLGNYCAFGVYRTTLYLPNPKEQG